MKVISTFVLSIVLVGIKLFNKILLKFCFLVIIFHAGHVFFKCSFSLHVPSVFILYIYYIFSFLFSVPSYFQSQINSVNSYSIYHKLLVHVAHIQSCDCTFHFSQLLFVLNVNYLISALSQPCGCSTSFEIDLA